MAKVSKRLKTLRASVEANKLYAIDEAIALVKGAATAKFDESVDVSFNLGVDPRKSDQVIRGSVVLPKGTGKTTRVAVFTQGANADAAKEAGADIVGFEDLAAEVKAGNLNFDVVIASPAHCGSVGHYFGSARPDAEPESGHGYAERSRGREKRQGRSSAIPHR